MESTWGVCHLRQREKEGEELEEELEGNEKT
jgi:hypothetical protein